MAEVQWWYARDDEQLGPLSPGELRRLAAGGGLAPTDLVWREGMSEWAPAARIKGLFPESRDPADEAPGHARPRDHPRAIRRPHQASRARRKCPRVSFRPTLRRGEMFAGELPAIAPSRPTPIDSGLFRAAGSTGRTERRFRPRAPSRALPAARAFRSSCCWCKACLWGTCGLVVLLGGLLFSVSRLRGTSPTEEAASATVLGMFFIGAYVVAQAGEKISRLVLSFLERRRDG